MPMQAMRSLSSGTSAQWADLRKRLSPLYEDLAADLRAWEVHVPSLRPTNYARNVLHIASAVSTVLIVDPLDAAADAAVTGTQHFGTGVLVGALSDPVCEAAAPGARRAPNDHGGALLTPHDVAKGRPQQRTDVLAPGVGVG